MTRHFVIFFCLTVLMIANGKTFSDKLNVENTSEAITDYNTLSHFIRGAIKCCPHVNLTYDPLKRLCMNSSADVNSELKIRQFNQSSVDSLSCDINNVLVDYEIVVLFTLEDEVLETTEESGVSTNASESSTDCDNKCDGSNSTYNFPLESKDYDHFPEHPSNLSGMTAERIKRLDSARVRIWSGGSFPKEGEDGGLLASFLPGGRLTFGGEIFGSDGFCIDVRSEAENTLYLTARVCVQGDRWCRVGRACVRKCCPDGENMVEKGLLQVPPNASMKQRICHPYFMGFPIIKDLGLRLPVGVYNGDVCGSRKKYILVPKTSPHDKWRLQQNGSLFLPDVRDLGPTYFSQAEYCLDGVQSPSMNMNGIQAYLCFPYSEEKKAGGLEHQINVVMEEVVYGVAILASCVFLLATLVAYAILPSLRNLHGVTLVSHASCLLAAFLCLATAKFTKTKFTKANLRGAMRCKVLGFSILFSFLAAFSWLNVMCFDIWWTFGQGRIGSKPGARGGSAKSGGALQGNLHKFIFYSIYAWMLPLTITVLTALADVYGDFLPYTPPRIGNTKCWFQDDGQWAVIIHFVGPSTILLLADVIMFTLTAVRCWRIKAEIQRMQHSDKEDTEREGDGMKKFGRKWWKQTYKADKDRLMMNLKLCAAMGVNWSLEIVSWWLSRGEDSLSNGILPKATWYLSDVANCLHGVFVFMVFVGKKKILAQLWKKLKGLSRCCPGGNVREDEQNIGTRQNHSYNTSSLQDITSANEGKTYNFNEENGRKIGRIRRWLINHGCHSRRKKNSRQCGRYLSKASTTSTSVSVDMSRGNVSYVP